MRALKIFLGLKFAVVILAAAAVALPSISPGQGVVTWGGAGADDNWSTGGNWTPSGPAAGDSLRFGGGVRLVNFNDLAPDTLVGGITFLNDTSASTAAFTLGGNRVTLGGDILTTAVNATNFNTLITDVIGFDLLLNGTRTITTNNFSDDAHNLTINGAISDGGGGFGLVKGGGARLTLTAGSSYSGATSITAGVLVLSHAQALPGGTGATGGTSALTLGGGILGLGVADFSRGLGTGADQVQFTGSGGFAAFGADRIVNIGGAGATMAWNMGGFVPTGGTLLFGYGNGSDTQDSTHTVDFQNPIDLNGAIRSISVNESGPTAVEAVLSGGLLDTATGGAFTKDGSGTLKLTAASTYAGQTRANAGTLILAHANALPGGVAATGGTSNLRLNSGTIGLTPESGDFTRGLGTGPDQIQWTSGGGFSAHGANRIVNLGGAGAGVTWGAGGFVITGQPLFLGAISADALVDFQNPIDLGATNRTVTVNNGTAAFDAEISGVISGSGGLVKNGDGHLILSSASNSFTGQFDLQVNTVQVAKLADFGENSSIGRGTAGAPILMSSQFRTGLLSYVGGGDTSDRTFQFGTTGATHANGGVIQSNGSGPLIFDAPVLNANIPGVTATRTLTLGGTNTGANAVTGVIQNTNGSTGLLNITKDGAGTWILAGANTYGGTTTLTAGTLHINNAGSGGVSSAIGTGPLAIGTGTTIDNSSGSALVLSTANAVSINGNFSFGGSHDLSFANGTASASGSRVITLNGSGRTLAFGVLSMTNSNTTTVTDAGTGNKLVLGSLVLAENNQTRTQTFNGNAAIEILGAISNGPGTGADSFSFTGNGALTLLGTNTYTGATTLNNAAGTLVLAGASATSGINLTTGRLVINHAAALGLGTLDINGGSIDTTTGASLAISTANLVTLDGNFSFGGGADLSFATGTAAVTGGRVITLNGTNRTLTFGALSMSNTLTTTVTDAGTGNKLVFGGLVLGENNQARTQTFNGNGIIEITGAVTDGPGTGAEALTYTGTGTMILGGAGSYTGVTTVNAIGGTLKTTASGGIGSSNVAVVQGTLELNHAAQTVGTITFGSTTNTTAVSPAVIRLAPGAVLTQNGTLTANDNVNQQATSITGGSMNLNGARTWTVDDSANLEIDFAVSSVVTNSDGGAGVFTKGGAGRLLLSGDNTFANPFSITDGILRIQHGNALGSTAGATTVTSGEALEIDGVSVTGETVNINGAGFGGNTGALRNLSGDNSWTGAVNLDGSSRIHADLGTQLTLGPITAGGTSRNITLGGDGVIIASGRIGSGGLNPVNGVTKEGAGMVVLSNTGNDYVSSTTISNGTLKLGASGVIPDTSSITLNKGTLDLAGFAETINALTFGGTTTTVAGLTANVIDTSGGGVLRLVGNLAYNIGSAGFENGQAAISATLDLNNSGRTFTVNDSPNAAVDLLISGAIINSGATASGFTKEGAGVLVLSGANAYNNTTTLRNGTIRAGADEVLPDGFSLSMDQRVGTVSTFDLAGHTETIGSLTMGSGSSTVVNSVSQIIDSSGGGMFRLGGNVTSNSGPAGFNNGTALISAVLDLNGATRTFTVNDSTHVVEDMVVSGVIRNGTGTAAGLTKSGAGTLVLSGANTYDGATTISAGVLRAQNNQAFGTTGAVSLSNTDAVLELANGISIDRSLTVSDSGNNKILRLQSGAAAAAFAGNITISEATVGNFDIAADASGVLTLAGVVGGTGAAGLTKEGAGTAALAGLNTYSGPTAVAAGVLQVGVGGIGQTGTGAVTVAATASITGSGAIRGATFTLSPGATLRPGDSLADSRHATLHFSPATASGVSHDLSGAMILSLTSPALFDGTFGGQVLGSQGYFDWLDGVTGVGAHDRLSFDNPGTGAGYTVSFANASGSLQVTGSDFVPQAGQVFNILDWGGLVSMDFSGFAYNNAQLTGDGDEGADLDLPNLTGTGFYWDVSRLTTSGVIAVVPEPSRVLLFLMALPWVLRRRR